MENPTQEELLHAYVDAALLEMIARANEASKSGDHGARVAWESAYDVLLSLRRRDYAVLAQFLTHAADADDVGDEAARFLQS